MKLVHVLFLFLTRFHVNVARSKGTPTWPRFKVTASCCDLPLRQYLEDLFNENGGVFLYDKSAYLSQNYKKTMLSWKSSGGAREKREEGDRRSGLSVTSKICPRRKLTSGSLNLSEETNKT